MSNGIRDSQSPVQHRPLHEIARDIVSDWSNRKVAAVPYINAMLNMHNVHSSYGFDSGDSIIRYFLSNAGTWHGEKARTIKTELRAILDDYDKSRKDGRMNNVFANGKDSIEP